MADAKVCDRFSCLLTLIQQLDVRAHLPQACQDACACRIDAHA